MCKEVSKISNQEKQGITMNYNIIIDKYYPQDNRLKEILMIHSRQVTARALKVCDLHPELHLDRQFVEEAAMIHDIGIFLCDAPAICCFGKEHYLRHGFLGAELMRKEGYPGHARVCERHTGAGLTAESIIAGHLLLPHRDFLPETMEEKVICYADKFYSKSKKQKEKTVEQVERSLAKFGEEGVERFREWVKMFA